MSICLNNQNSLSRCSAAVTTGAPAALHAFVHSAPSRPHDPSSMIPRAALIFFVWGLHPLGELFKIKILSCNFNWRWPFQVDGPHGLWYRGQRCEFNLVLVVV